MFERQDQIVSTFSIWDHRKNDNVFTLRDHISPTLSRALRKYLVKNTKEGKSQESEDTAGSFGKGEGGLVPSSLWGFEFASLEFESWFTHLAIQYSY